MSDQAELRQMVYEGRFNEHAELSAMVINLLYTLSTIPEEITLISQQKWGPAKILFKLVRYCPPLWSIFYFLRTGRTFLAMSNAACKFLLVTSTILVHFIPIACDVTVGICISALLGLNIVGLIVVLIICATIPAIAWILNIWAISSYPAQDPWDLNVYFGCMCYLPSFRDLDEASPVGWELEERNITHFATTAAIALLALGAMVWRWRNTSGRLITVIRRDGGIYLIIVTIFRLANALLSINAIMEDSDWHGWPLNTLLTLFQTLIYPILVQQLLLNMRKVDYMGTKAVASTLMFSPPRPACEDDATTFSVAQVVYQPDVDAMNVQRGVKERKDGEV